MKIKIKSFVHLLFNFLILNKKLFKNKKIYKYYFWFLFKSNLWFITFFSHQKKYLSFYWIRSFFNSGKIILIFLIKFLFNIIISKKNFFLFL